MKCNLFHSIKPLFSGKPVMLVVNKIDVTRLEDLTPENRVLVQEIINSEGIFSAQVSCHSEEGVMELKNKACDTLLAFRVDNKLKSNKIDAIANRIHVAQPRPRDNVVREPFIPNAVKERKKYTKDDPERRRLLKDQEIEDGGPGVFNINMKSEPHFLISLITPNLYLHRGLHS